jgi:hypothetical protein
MQLIQWLCIHALFVNFVNTYFIEFYMVYYMYGMPDNIKFLSVDKVDKYTIEHVWYI